MGIELIVKTILIFLLTFLGYSEWFLGTSYVQRPIVLGPLVGLAMGDLTSGIIMGATLELAMIGSISVGAYNPPDPVAGTVLGVALAIQSHASVGAALTMGIPIATVMLALNTALGQPVMLIFIHKCDRDAAQANTRKFTIDMLISGWTKNLPGLIFVPLAFYFGSGAVEKMLNFIPDFVQSGMNIAAGILPALGFAMLLKMIVNKKNLLFFFFGFFIIAFTKFTVTEVAIFSFIIVAFMLFYIPENEENLSSKVSSSETDGDGFDEF